MATKRDKILTELDKLYGNNSASKPYKTKREKEVAYKTKSEKAVVPDVVKAYLDVADVSDDNADKKYAYYETANGFTVREAQDQYNTQEAGLVNAYADNIGGLDKDYSAGITGIAKSYKENALSNKKSYDEARNAYGANKQSLSGAGLIDSGYAYYLGEDLNREYHEAKAYLDSYSAESEGAYKDTYDTTLGTAKTALSEGKAQNKGVLQQAWQNAENAYTKDLNAYSDFANTAKVNSGVNAYDINKINEVKSKFGAEADGIVTKLQSANYDYYKKQIDSAPNSAEAWGSLDTAYKNGEISKGDYQKTYYLKALNDIKNIDTQEEFTIIETNVKKNSEQYYGAYKSEIEKALKAIDKTKFPKNESGKTAIKAVDNATKVAEILSPYDYYDSGLDLEKGWSEFKEWWEKIKNNANKILN